MEEYGIVDGTTWYKQPNWRRNNLGIENFITNEFEINKEFEDDIKNMDFDWMPPIARPGKVLCIGRNYAAHSQEQGKDPETKPLIFSKFSSSMAGHLSQIKFPNHTEYLDYEVELAVIIGKTATKLAENENPIDYVFGFTIANDLTARDVQKSEKQWTRGKGFDNSLPIGPTITTTEEVSEPNNNDIWLTVNGEKRQLSKTSNMIFDIKYLIWYISQSITLEPGDIILTGTPEGVGYYMEPQQTLEPGDLVACGVTEIDELRFTITE